MNQQKYWLQQRPGQPLFQDLLWSRPENKNLAGKLLIVGGNLHGFAAPAAAYSEAVKAGAGQVRVLMPDAIQKTVGKLLPDADFAPSTRSGSFARSALGAVLDAAAWADCVMLAGAFGKNSETTLLLDSFLTKHKGPVCAVKDTVDLFMGQTLLLKRPNTTLVLTMAQLQKLGISAAYQTAFTFGMGVPALAENLAAFTREYPANIIIRHLDTILVACAGKVSSTPSDTTNEQWRIKTAAAASVFWMQNPANVFEALTVSLIA